MVHNYCGKKHKLKGEKVKNAFVLTNKGGSNTGDHHPQDDKKKKMTYY